MLHRISHRLLFLITVAILALSGVGVNALWQLSASKQDFMAISQDTLPGVMDVAGMRYSATQYRAILRDHILSNTEEKKQFEQGMGTAKSNFEQYLAKYIGTEHGRMAERELTDAVSRAASTYFLAANEIMLLSQAGQTVEATAALPRLIPLNKALMVTIDALFNFNLEKTRAFVAESERREAQARVLTIALALGSSALLIVVAWTTYRGIIGKTRQAQQEIDRVVSTRDFSRPVSAEGNDEISLLLQKLNELIAGLRGGLTEIRHGADQVAAVSESMAEAASQVTASSRTQTDSAVTMAANVEQVVVSINHVSDRTGEASTLVSMAGDEARGGRDAVMLVVERIEEMATMMRDASTELTLLDESGQSISAVMGVIKDVADQTNLLALNAAIEAARAGEQGRGFAVVADEVRKLAERTAASTVQIADMVTDIQTRSASVVARMKAASESVAHGITEGRETRDAIQRIADASSTSRSLVTEIANALREQSVASDTIASQVERVAQMSEENNRVAESSKKLAEELQKLSGTMRHVVGSYTL